MTERDLLRTALIIPPKGRAVLCVWAAVPGVFCAPFVFWQSLPAGVVFCLLWAALVAVVYQRACSYAAALGAEAVDGGSMTAFELACDNAVTAYLRTAKLVSYGPEALIAYLAAVESETTAVRMILTGRLAGIAPDTIRERLRDMYA